MRTESIRVVRHEPTVRAALAGLLTCGALLANTGTGLRDAKPERGLKQASANSGAGRWVELPNSLLTDQRKLHSVTLLPTGEILVAAGELSNVALDSAELFDPASGTWRVTGSLTTGRLLHTATLLPSGRVLVAGGDADGRRDEVALASVELYDPPSGTWQQAAALHERRLDHTATLLRDGSVLIVGGREASSNGLSSAELYHAETGTWLLAGAMTQRRWAHTATRLLDGRVLVVGGNAGGTLVSVELYDPQSQTWSPARPLAEARSHHSATLLPSGEVLVAGGLVENGLVENVPLASAELYDPERGTWTTVEALATARAFHSATLLASGKILVAGGGDGALGGGIFLGETEFYDPRTGSWSSAGDLVDARRDHTATLLPTGNVLITGGQDVVNNLRTTELYVPQDGVWRPVATRGSLHIAHSTTLIAHGPRAGQVLVDGPAFVAPELYDPRSETWTTLPSTLPSFEANTATLLPSGKILIAGGGTGNLSLPLTLLDYLASVVPSTFCKLFDPTSGEFAESGSLAHARLFHTATLLPSGEVLAVGGFLSLDDPNVDDSVAEVEIYHPETGTWSEVEPLPRPRAFHTATLLASGKVLVVGGLDNEVRLLGAELYDPSRDTWSAAGRLSFDTFLHTATLLPSGEVLVAGGSTDKAELYDPETNTWRPTGGMTAERLGHSAILLASGQVLVAGGAPSETENILQSAELYDRRTETWTPVADMAGPRALHTSTLLPSGEVLLVGGAVGNFDDGFLPLSGAEIYQPTALATALASNRRPEILTVDGELAYGGTLRLSGNDFAGGPEASQGDTRNASASYPLVQLRNLEDGGTSWLPYEPLETFAEGPATLEVSRLPPELFLSSGWHLLTVYRAGIPSVSRFARARCGLIIDLPPEDQTVRIGETATFSVGARGGRTFQWRKNGVDIPGATDSTYTTSPVTGVDAGTAYSVKVDSGCASRLSEPAALRVLDETRPRVEVRSPRGGDVWFLSEPGAPNIVTAVWSMEDELPICHVKAALRFSTDGGQTYREAVSANWGKKGEACAHPGVEVTSVPYRVPMVTPSGTLGSLYKVRVVVTDHAGNIAMAESANPFFIARADPDSFKTLVLTNLSRMKAAMDITEEDEDRLRTELQNLVRQPTVRGRLVELDKISDLDDLYARWDADPASFEKANQLLFGDGGLHQKLLEQLSGFTGVENLILVGDDRIIPMARLRDRTVLFLESNYTAEDPGTDLDASLSAAGTTVGQALAADQYLSDDPLATIEPLRPEDLQAKDALFPPDLAVGRLVETPAEIITAIATFISQSGVLDLSEAEHKVQVSGYDFLIDSGRRISQRWKGAFGQGDDFLAPVDAELLSADWGAGTAEERKTIFFDHLSGNGGNPYLVLNPNGHATHHELGVPGLDRFDIQGVRAVDLSGGDTCQTSPGHPDPPDLAGRLVYAIGCHGGLSVPGSCATDGERSLDLPQTLLGRGVMAFLANSGYGWGLLNGIGLSERLAEIFTEELLASEIVVVGEAVRRGKERYFLESPRFDAYDAKTVMQWTLYGFPMYKVTGIVKDKQAAQRPFAGAPPKAAELRRVERLGPAEIERQLSGGFGSLGVFDSGLPPFLTRLEQGFTFAEEGTYLKFDAAGELLDPEEAGCPDSEGCYYTLNGLTTGTADLPIEPLFIFDSRLSGTSQHGVLWKGGVYEIEDDWRPLFAELASSGCEGGEETCANHGSTPRRIYIRPRGPRRRGSLDGGPSCPASDTELNSVVFSTGEAVKVGASGGADPSWRHTLHRRVDLEVLYFNNTLDAAENCDRTGPDLSGGPFHTVRGRTVEWAVPASDEAGVWRVVVVVTDETVDGEGRGRWIPFELADDGTGVWRGSWTVTGSEKVTYYLQALDRRGNVSWLTYDPDEPPPSGVDPELPQPVEVDLGSRR